MAVPFGSLFMKRLCAETTRVRVRGDPTLDPTPALHRPADGSLAEGLRGGADASNLVCKASVARAVRRGFLFGAPRRGRRGTRWLPLTCHRPPLHP